MVNNDDLFIQTERVIEPLRSRIVTSDSDLTLLNRLSKELQKSGAIVKPVPEGGAFGDPGSLEEALENAIEGAQYEKDVNPLVYQEEFDNSFLIDDNIEWVNPMIDLD